MEVRRGGGYVVPFWAIEGFRPEPKEFVIRLRVRRLIRVYRLSRDGFPKLKDLFAENLPRTRRKSSITFVNRRRPYLPHDYRVKFVNEVVRLRIDRFKRLLINKTTVMKVTRWERIKREYLETHKDIPKIEGIAIRDDRPKYPRN